MSQRDEINVTYNESPGKKPEERDKSLGQKDQYGRLDRFMATYGIKRRGSI